MNEPMKTDSDLSKLENIIDGATQLANAWSQKRSDLRFTEKSVGQIVSDADTDIEAFIRGHLAECFPGQAIIGEEFGGELSSEQSGWAIDPIDGTTNFVLGLPLWAISLGYYHHGESVLGAISLPDLGLMLTAAKGDGLRINFEPDSTKHQPPSVKAIALGENDFESGAQTDSRAQSLRAEGYGVVRYRCAVFSLAMSAMGRLSGYVEHGCGLWDIAAAEVICREAGMSVETQKLTSGEYAIDARWAT